MKLPDYYLARPVCWSEADAGEFAQLYDEQVRPGTGVTIDYGLTAPKWQFLCWLTECRDLLLHGSGHPGLTRLEPRAANDASEFGAQEAVFAASDGIWAMFFAIVNRPVVSSLVNGSFVLWHPPSPASYYYFSINDDAFDGEPWRPGVVYLLPRDRFVRQPDEEEFGMRVEVNQWASLQPVAPLAVLEVSPEDFPFLDQVNAHDVDVLSVRAAANPSGFPWRD